jgi:tRNA threonylcarbamoyladenosine biosynthesis protein TsaE
MKMISKSVHDTLKIGGKIAKNLSRGDIVCLFGELGSGKTVLAKGIASGLGIDKDEIISPTFVVLRQQCAKDNVPFYHFDFYRLGDCDDILGLGHEEYLYGEGITVIEWADRLKFLMPDEYLKIELSVKGERSRAIAITAVGCRYKKKLENMHEDLRH